jgi:hypothetical protein
VSAAEHEQSRETARSHKIRVGYSQIQSVVEARGDDPSNEALVATIHRIIGELVADPEALAENLYALLAGAAFFGSGLLLAAHDLRNAAKTDAEILRQLGQVVNAMLELDREGG